MPRYSANDLHKINGMHEYNFNCLLLKAVQSLDFVASEFLCEI